MINRQTKKIGIFDFEKFNWLSFDGIIFDDKYSKMGDRGEFYISNKNINYILEKYTKGSEDASTLYALFEFGGTSKITADAYFFTNNQWNKLIKDKKVTPKSAKSPIAKIKNFEPEKDVDIKEYAMNKKGGY
jgi:hypothetical protein